MLLTGARISARDIEHLMSNWSPEKFTSLCNSLLWAAAGSRAHGFPSFNPTVEISDDGIDAEWELDIPPIENNIPSPIVGPGWNVFQYKKRDIHARDRSSIISKMKAKLKGAAREIAAKKGCHPDHYVLFTNVDISQKKDSLKKAILENYAPADSLRVEILGAGEFEALLNNYPHIRLTFFPPYCFTTWQSAWDSHVKSSILQKKVDLTGRQEELKNLKSIVDDSRIRIVLIKGLSGIGKTRMALEATEHKKSDTVFLSDSYAFKAEEIRLLASSEREVVVVIENAPLDAFDSIIRTIQSSEGIKAIITIHPETTRPLFLSDERIQLYSLPLLSLENSWNFLKSLEVNLDFGLMDWIVSNAGGIPAILLGAAAAGERLRTDRDLLPQIAQDIAQWSKNRVSAEAFKSLELFSLLTHVGIAGKFQDELKEICRLFGRDMDTNDMLNAIDELEQAGLLRKERYFAEISIPLIANHLAQKVIRGRKAELFSLFASLHEGARLRLIERLCQLGSEEVTEFFGAFFEKDAPLETFQKAIGHPSILELAAMRQPEKTIALLEEGLDGSSYEERLKIEGNRRRLLVETLGWLLFKRSTGRRAIELLFLLAEAENENCANNATGILSESFHPYHPQIQLSISQRISIFREFTSRNITEKGRIAAISAIKGIIEDGIFLGAPHGDGGRPPDAIPSWTFRDIVDYYRDIIDILFELARDDDRAVATEAIKVLPEVIANLATRAHPKEAINRFKKMVAMAKQGIFPVDVSDLSDTLRRVNLVIEHQIEDPEFPADQRKTYLRDLQQFERIRKELEKGDTLMRLKRWAGQWSIDDYEGGRYRRELEKIARETIKSPQLMNNENINWLMSPFAAKSLVFFTFLGMHDRKEYFRPQVEDLSFQSKCSNCLEAYMEGWFSRAPAKARKRLIELFDQCKISKETFLRAVSRMKPDREFIEFIIGSIKRGKLEREITARDLFLFCSPSVLDVDTFGKILTEIAGENLENSLSALRLIFAWTLHKPEKTDESIANLALKCFKTSPFVTEFDNNFQLVSLSVRLARDNQEWGFQLLEYALSEELEANRKVTFPREPRYSRDALWRTLYVCDSSRFLRIAIILMKRGGELGFQISDFLKRALDQEKDRDLILSYARENEGNARIIAGLLTRSRKGFWPIAEELFKILPQDEILQRNLSTGLDMDKLRKLEEPSSIHEECTSEIRQKLKDPSIPGAMRIWLKEILGRVEDRPEPHVVWEYGEAMRDLVSFIEDRKSPQREWAIGRVMKFAEWKDLRRLLTIEDIEESLPKVDLPEKKRTTLEKAIKVWKNEL